MAMETPTSCFVESRNNSVKLRNVSSLSRVLLCVSLSTKQGLEAVGDNWRDEKLPFGASSTSSDVLDPCLMNNYPLASISNTENKNISPDRANHYLSLERQDYMERIRELNDRLDMVKNIARPGCSYELLNTALCYMSSLATILSEMPQKLHASL